jgi:hypothetical protein
MSRFILEGFATEELVDALHNDAAFPLVRELCHKFNLKVLTCVSRQVGDYDLTARKFQLCLSNGIAVGKAWAVMGGSDEDAKYVYYYRSPYYVKERGRSREDKETLKSTKVSSLVATMKRVGAIPSVPVMNDKKLSRLQDAVGLLNGAMGNSTKSSSELSADEIQALLCAYLGETPNGNHLTIDTIKCQKVLDKYNEADRVVARRVEETNRFFGNPFYMIGSDEYGHFLVGKVKIVGHKQYEIIESFKRYKDITEYTDLIPVMTMTKLAYEGKKELQGGYLPITDKYDENLDAAFFYNTRATHYDYIWMVTPC